ncbi:unnamed protein product [Caenorhabditis bovis]|uniref:SPK domain-containing protein n=1 Tax=Caenorhabditis bovis TaxID=2654633 RepID=A0A8S1ETX0_9PELO|nr:unnamed protein product [Caenorhabditis bovis]
MVTSEENRRDIDIEDENVFWNFIHEKIVVKKEFDVVNFSLWENFKAMQNPTWTVEELDEYYNDVMKDCLYKAEIDRKIILELYQHLKLPLDDHAEKLLEKDIPAIIRRNARKEVVRFRIVGEHQTAPAPQRTVSRSQLLIQNPPVAKTTPTTLVSNAEKSPLETPAPSRQSSPVSVWTNQPIEKREKDIEEPRSSNSSSPKREVIDNEDDGYKELVYRFTKPKRSGFTCEDHRKMWMHIYKEAFTSSGHLKDVFESPKGLILWRKYIALNQCSKSDSNLASHYRKVMRFNLHRARLDRDILLKLYDVVDIPLPMDVIKELEHRFSIKVNVQDGRLYSWTEVVEEKKADEKEKEEKEEDSDDTVPLSKEMEDDGPENLQNRNSSTTNTSKKTPKRRLSSTEKDHEKTSTSSPNKEESKRKRSQLPETPKGTDTIEVGKTSSSGVFQTREPSRILNWKAPSPQLNGDDENGNNKRKRRSSQILESQSLSEKKRNDQNDEYSETLEVMIGSCDSQLSDSSTFVCDIKSEPPSEYSIISEIPEISLSEIKEREMSLNKELGEKLLKQALELADRMNINREDALKVYTKLCNELKTEQFLLEPSDFESFVKAMNFSDDRELVESAENVIQQASKEAWNLVCNSTLLEWIL